MAEFKKDVLRHIEKVIEEYTNRGFEVTSCESENLGWDLEAAHKKTLLRLEVKGCQGVRFQLK